MPTKNRRKNITVIDHLTEQPFDFCFKQAVRLLERSAVLGNSSAANIPNKPVAQYMPPASEFIRFNTHTSFSFAASDIKSIKKSGGRSASKQWVMNNNFIGLIGGSGILPFHYTETALQRLKLKDHSMVDFFNIFNHRTTSLFYRATCKYSFSISYEKNKLAPIKNDVSDNYTQSILSLIGFGTKHLSNRLHIKDESLIFYSGLFAEKVRTPTGLQQILQNHFCIPVEIKEFVGQWQNLIRDVRTRLSSSTTTYNNCLGQSVILGKKGWFAQGKIQIILGPLNKTQLHKFSPGTNTLKTLDEIVHLYVGLEHGYDFIMRIKKKDIPERVELSKETPSIVGWNTWLSNKNPNISDSEETIDIPVSHNR